MELQRILLKERYLMSSLKLLKYEDKYERNRQKKRIFNESLNMQLFL